MWRSNMIGLFKFLFSLGVTSFEELPPPPYDILSPNDNPELCQPFSPNDYPELNHSEFVISQLWIVHRWFLKNYFAEYRDKLTSSKA